jgi:hypothetical protein
VAREADADADAASAPNPIASVIHWFSLPSSCVRAPWTTLPGFDGVEARELHGRAELLPGIACAAAVAAARLSERRPCRHGARRAVVAGDQPILGGRGAVVVAVVAGRWVGEHVQP